MVGIQPNTEPSRDGHELGRFKYEIVLFQNEIDDLKRSEYIEKIRSLLSDYPDTFRIASEKGKFECLINAGQLLSSIFKLADPRVLFSDDSRNFEAKNFRLNRFELDSTCRSFSIESNRWEHDVSFWLDKAELDYGQFLTTINQTCCGLVRFVRLVDRFDDLANRRVSYCFRLRYESCDRALDWETSRSIQSRLREMLTNVNRFVMR